MNKFIRSLIVMPLLALLLVTIPAVLFSVLGDTPSAVGQTVPPPTGTVVPPTHVPRPPRIPPTPVPARVPDLRARANGFLLEKVIGDRQSATIYGVAFNGRLFRTENNGSTWALVSSRPRFGNFIMSPADPYVLYSAEPLNCEEGDDSEAVPAFYRSVDGGVIWEDTAPAMALVPLLANSADADVVLAAACDGLYQSSDRGDSWTPLATGSTDRVWAGLVPKEAWAAFFAGTPADEATWDILYVVATGDDGDVILSSIDGGARWMVITPIEDTTLFDISSLTGDPTSDLRTWFTDEQGVWSTEDGGNLWGLSSQGLTGVLARGLNDVEHHPSEMLLLATGRGFYAKATDETLWKPLGTGVFLRLNINNLLFTDSRSDKIWLNTLNGVYVYTLR